MADYQFDAKQPSEEYYLEFDFSNDLTVLDQNISSVASVAVTDSNDQDVTSTLTTEGNQANDTTSVYVWCKAGSDGEDYKFTVKITGDGSPAAKLEMDVTLPVREQ